MKNSKLYSVWAVMKQRCQNPKNCNWQWYGAKGIKVCEEWSGRTGHLAFIPWAEAAGWRPGLQIDRIDRQGDYSPSNCRFVTRVENLRNRVFTDKWRKHLAEVSAKGRANITPARIASARANVAKARETLRLMRSQAK